MPFTHHQHQMVCGISIILCTFPVTAKEWIQGEETCLVDFTSLMTTTFVLIFLIEHESLGKSFNISWDMKPLVSLSFSKASNSVSGNFISVNVCQKLAPSFMSAITLSTTVEGESGSPCLALSLSFFLLPRTVGSRSRRLQNEHLWQRLMCVQGGKEQSKENTQRQIHYSPFDNPLALLFLSRTSFSV